MGARSDLRWVVITAALGIAAMPAAAVAQSPAGPDAAPGSSSGSPNPDPAPSAARKPAVVVVKRTIPPARVAAPTVTQSSKSTPSTTAAAPPTVTSTAAIKPARRATPQHHKTKPVHRKRKDPPAKTHSAVLHVPSLPHLSPARLVVNSPSDDAARARKLAAGAVSLLLLALASGILLAMAAKGERRRVAR